MPGPSKKPAFLKVVSGTVQPCRVEPELDVPTLEAVPEPVDWLPNAHAVNEWRRLAPILVRQKMLREADLSPFGHLCALHGKMVQLWAAGESPTGHMISQYNALASAFGLSPAWLRKVRAGGNQTQGGKFGKFKEPPAG